MSLADEWFGVAQLLTPEELINPNVDELSMMTYLAQFREAKVKEGAPIQTENHETQLTGSGMESFEPTLTNDDQKPAAVDVSTANKSEEALQEENASSLDNLSEGRRRSCCSYFLVVLVAVIVAFISTRQYDSETSWDISRHWAPWEKF